MSVITSIAERPFGSLSTLSNDPAMTRLVSSRRSSSSASYETRHKSSDDEGAGMNDGGWVRRKRRSRIPVRHPTGLYVHSSPPTVIPVHPSIVRQWLRGGEINRLQEIVLNKKIEDLHDAARAGKIENVDAILRSEPRINLELSKDGSSTGILHKAVIHGHVLLQNWLLKNYPKTIEVLDKEKRNPLHYAGGNEEVWNRLVAGGADTSTADREGYSPAYYMNHPRRLRPPAPDARTRATSNQSLVVKPSNIRIWIHDKDLGRLQRVLWEGLGDKLKTETSSQPLVRRFLNAVPFIMGSIRDVHTAAVNNDVELLLSKSSDPVPKEILLSKDSNGLSALHKAAGLGNAAVAEAIIRRAPEAVNARDNLDRTPLHYAGAARDDNKMYQLLVESNATDHIEDKKGNTPSYYRTKPTELDGGKLLHLIPDAPRTAHIFPPSWDWRLLTGETISDTPLTSPQVEHLPQMADDKDPDDVNDQPEEASPNDLLSESEVSLGNEILVEQGRLAGGEDVPLGISDDEGVGSEVNPSVENTSTPLSDNVNEEEEEEISGARLGETVTLSSSLFRSKTSVNPELGSGVDSGNEEGDSSENALPSGETETIESPEADALAEQRTGSPIADDSNNQNTPPASAELGPDNRDIPPEAKMEEVVQASAQELEDPEVSPDSVQQIVRPKSTIKTPQTRPDSQLDVNEDNEINTDETEAATNYAATVENVGEEQADNENIVALGTKDNDDQNLISSPELGSTNINHSSYTGAANGSRNASRTESANEEILAATETLSGEAITTVNDGHSTPATPYLTVEDGDSASNTPDVNVDDGNITSASPTVAVGDDEMITEEERATSDNITLQELTENQTIGANSGTPNILNDLPEVMSHEENSITPNQNGSRPATQTLKKSNRGSGSEASRSRGMEGDNSKESQENKEYIETGNSPQESENDELKNDNPTASIESSTNSPIRSKTAPKDEENQSSNEPIYSAANDQNQEIRVKSGSIESNMERDGEETHFLDRPITTRSAGGSRAEILAITPAPLEETDGLDDQQIVEDRNSEEDRVEAEELVAAGDMESMAEMVLNGRGTALLNMNSSNPDVQMFIDNIPQYIAKIERVHAAAREGDLRGVQTALDRRKFAVARDNSTPLKPTPLHVAALFGRTSVLRYLAGRFPESMHAQDAAGRTALHYAATLPDNGHFYSLLVTLGADKSVVDNDGQTAEHYLRSKGELTREELLNEYQNRSVPIDAAGLNFNRFSDKGAEIIKGGYPIFNPEEGQYLANSLGEPLVKGLTEIAHVRPKNPVVHLANFLLVYNKPEEGESNSKRALTANTERSSSVDVSSSMEERLQENEAAESSKVHKQGDNFEDEQENREEEEENSDDEVAGVEGDPLQSVDPAFKPTNLDEHGQTILHFAGARSHGRNAIFQLLQEMDVNPGLRDGLYRTARDIAEQMEIVDNVQGIDKYVVAIAARGENDKLTELLLEGYDHILDAEDGESIIEIAKKRENEDTVELLQSIVTFEERREKLIRAIRFGSVRQVKELFEEAPNKRHLAVAKNQQARCSLHVAVLAQNENIVEYIAKRHPSALHTGDNLMRTPLHYAMGVDKVEPLSRILIASGAQRVVKDLKGRQPSYYFMNKTDIQKLQDEEEALRV